MSDQSFGDHMRIAPITINLAKDMFASPSECPFRKFEVIKSRGSLARILRVPKYNLVIDVKSENHSHTCTCVKVSFFHPIRYIQIKYYKYKYREKK